MQIANQNGYSSDAVEDLNKSWEPVKFDATKLIKQNLCAIYVKTEYDTIASFFGQTIREWAESNYINRQFAFGYDYSYYQQVT